MIADLAAARLYVCLPQMTLCQDKKEMQELKVKMECLVLAIQLQ
jgi:hypothetical protein